MANEAPPTGVLRRLSRTRAAMRAAIVIERLWPLVLPLVIVASLFVSLSWLGLFRIAPDGVRLGVLGMLVLAGLGSLYPLRLFRAPTAAEVNRRIERANRLEHAPLHAQSDRPAAGDAFAAALWREHQKRMAARLDRLGADLPHARIPERDPWGLRAAAALLFVIAFAFSFGPLGGRLGDAFSAHGGAAAVAARSDAWVTPPAYTGRAPIFLKSCACPPAAPSRCGWRAARAMRRCPGWRPARKSPWPWKPPKRMRRAVRQGRPRRAASPPRSTVTGCWRSIPERARCAAGPSP
jgi:uncharacterized protein (TIGR02302 family)